MARIGPNHILTDDPETVRRILAARSGYVRGPWFDSVRIDPHIPNIVSERDVRKHRDIRSKLAPSVSFKHDFVTDQISLTPFIVYWTFSLGDGTRH